MWKILLGLSLDRTRKLPPLSKTVRVEVDGESRCATLLFHVKDDVFLQAPNKAALLFLEQMERKLIKNPIEAEACRSMIQNLDGSGYIVKLQPEEVVQGMEVWYMRDH